MKEYELDFQPSTNQVPLPYCFILISQYQSQTLGYIRFSMYDVNKELDIANS